MSTSSSTPLVLDKRIVEKEISWGAFTLEGKTLGHLAKAKENAFIHVNQLTTNVQTSAPVVGTNDDFLSKHGNAEGLQRQMKNKGKKCPQCGKVVAFTLPTCNQCGHNLKDVPLSFSNNVFMAFVYGLEKGPFPFTISIRLETPEIIVFDDLLALSACHLNVIPTTQFLPDWRYLLKDPKKGLELLNTLFDKSWEVVKAQFLANEEWRKQYIKDGAKNLTEDQLRSHVIAGFNYPPSQFQLHMQFMLPPLTPFHYFQYLLGTHYTEGRFFPVEYARQVLALNEPFPNLNENTSVEEIFAFFKTKGVDYHQIHAQCYARYGESHRLLANFNPDQFEGISTSDNKFFQFTNTIGTLNETSLDPKQIQTQDKTTIQNYGRPYTSDNKTTGSYYKYAKQYPNDVNVW